MMKLKKTIIILLFYFIVGCELNRTQTSILTGALDRYEEKQSLKEAKSYTKCRVNIFDELVCYEY